MGTKQVWFIFMPSYQLIHFSRTKNGKNELEALEATLIPSEHGDQSFRVLRNLPWKHFSIFHNLICAFFQPPVAVTSMCL